MNKMALQTSEQTIRVLWWQQKSFVSLPFLPQEPYEDRLQGLGFDKIYDGVHKPHFKKHSEL